MYFLHKKGVFHCHVSLQSLQEGALSTIVSQSLLWDLGKPGVTSRVATSTLGVYPTSPRNWCDVGDGGTTFQKRKQAWWVFPLQVIQFVTFSSPSWRSLHHFKGSLHHPKKVTKNCQAFVFSKRDFPFWTRENMGNKHPWCFFCDFLRRLKCKLWLP